MKSPDLKKLRMDDADIQSQAPHRSTTAMEMATPPPKVYHGCMKFSIVHVASPFKPVGALEWYTYI